MYEWEFKLVLYIKLQVRTCYIGACSNYQPTPTRFLSSVLDETMNSNVPQGVWDLYGAKDIQMNIISCLAISGVHVGVPSSGAILFFAININEFKQFLP